MNFTYVPQLVASEHAGDPPVFTVERLWKGRRGRSTELSHMVDRTYLYQSSRELQWHLADRFGVPVAALELHRA